VSPRPGCSPEAVGLRPRQRPLPGVERPRRGRRLRGVRAVGHPRRHLARVAVVGGYLRRENLESPEYFALMLCSATGMLLMASANDLITIFLSLEILSIALYVLAAFDRTRLSSQEAGLKYFLLGSFSSAGVPVRHRARLRLDRHDQPQRPSPSSSPTSCSCTTVCCSSGSRCSSSASGSRSRPRLSTCGLPTCTRARHAGHRIHGRGDEGGAFAAVAADLRRCVSAHRRRLRPRSSASQCCRSWSQRRRSGADRREANARLLVHLARGLRC